MTTDVLLRHDSQLLKYVVNMAKPIRLSTVESFLSLAYVNTIASMAQFCFHEMDDKYDLGFKIDGTIYGYGYDDEDPNVVYSAPEINVQLKATMETYVSRIDGNIHYYDLDMQTFKRLSGKSQKPHLLILLILPDNVDKWTTHTVDELTLRKCAYWCSLRNYPNQPPANNKNVTVEIPDSNCFCVDQLKGLMDITSRGGNIEYGVLRSI